MTMQSATYQPKPKSRKARRRRSMKPPKRQNVSTGHANCQTWGIPAQGLSIVWPDKTYWGCPSFPRSLSPRRRGAGIQAPVRHPWVPSRKEVADVGIIERPCIPEIAFRSRWSNQDGDGGLDSRLRGNDGPESANRRFWWRWSGDRLGPDGIPSGPKHRHIIRIIAGVCCGRWRSWSQCPSGCRNPQGLGSL